MFYLPGSHTGLTRGRFWECQNELQWRSRTDNPPAHQRACAASGGHVCAVVPSRTQTTPRCQPWEGQGNTENLNTSLYLCYFMFCWDYMFFVCFLFLQITVLQLSALLKQADSSKRKLTLTRLASAPVPFTVLSLTGNPCNEDYLAVCGLKVANADKTMTQLFFPNDFSLIPLCLSSTGLSRSDVQQHRLCVRSLSPASTTCNWKLHHQGHLASWITDWIGHYNCWFCQGELLYLSWNCFVISLAFGTSN